MIEVNIKQLPLNFENFYYILEHVKIYFVTWYQGWKYRALYSQDHDKIFALIRGKSFSTEFFLKGLWKNNFDASN